MSFKIALLGTAAVAVVAGAGYALWPAKAPRAARSSGVDAPAPVRAATNDATGTRLQNDVSSLRGEVKDVRSQLSMVQADLNQRAAPAGESEPPLSREEQRARTEEKRHAIMAEVAAAFEREQPDVTWAASTTTLVQEKLKNVPALAGAGPIECRASTCRFEIDRGDVDFDKQLPEFLNSVGQTLPTAQADYQVVNGKGRYTFFLKDMSRAPAPAAK